MLLNARGRISVLTHVVCLLGVIKETIGTTTGCSSAALGMESGAITDSQITASTSRSPLLSASAARLHNVIQMPISFGSWCADELDTSQYLQIDLLDAVNITAISTQGFEYAGGHWVTRYSLAYNCDGRKWQQYSVNGTVHEFNANNDTRSVARNGLPVAITARMIRVQPLTWNRHGAICMRMELYGCPTEKSCRTTAAPPPTTTTYKTQASTRRKTVAMTTDHQPTTFATTIGVTMTDATSTLATTQPTTEPACTSALGMESGLISDSQITASSHRSVAFLPAAARLNNDYRSSSLSFGAWCARDSDQQQYIQIDLRSPTTVVAIATQGMAAVEGNWVTSYLLSYSCDGITWFVYEEEGKKKVLQANSNGQRVVRQDLVSHVTARFVRVRPITWNSIGNICLRLELYGCNTSKACTAGNKTEGSSLSTTMKTEVTKTPATHHQPTLATNRPITEDNPSQETEVKTKKRKKITVIYVQEPENAATCSQSRTLITLIIVMLAFLLKS